jgi:hypothetical protein
MESTGVSVDMVRRVGNMPFQTRHQAVSVFDRASVVACSVWRLEELPDLATSCCTSGSERLRNWFLSEMH